MDTSEETLLSRRAENDEADLLVLVDAFLRLAGDVVWAVDQPGDTAALLSALSWESEQKVIYLPGLAVDRPATFTRASLRPTAATPPTTGSLLE